MIHRLLNLMKLFKLLFKFYYQHVYSAVFSNAYQILKIFFDKGLDFQKTVKTRKYAIQIVKQAIVSQSIDCLILFLERGVSINGGPNSTPLINAVKNGLTEAILPLIENGANQYKQTPDGETALSAACKTQNVEAVKILVDNMIDIDLKPNDKLIFKIIFFLILQQFIGLAYQKIQK